MGLGRAKIWGSCFEFLNSSFGVASHKGGGPVFMGAGGNVLADILTLV